MTHEFALYERGAYPVVGLDEAGRGPWAGPVVAAAVILDPDHIPDGLNDSKKLSRDARNALFDEILETATVGVGIADVDRIDTMNILHASMWAMAEAAAQLPAAPAHALVDGNRLPPGLPCAADALVKGDARSCSIAAASIVAKVTRDRIMSELAKTFPFYGWETNVGYGTRAHQQGLAAHGVTDHHRRSFAPIKKLIDSAA